MTRDDVEDTTEQLLEVLDRDLRHVADLLSQLDALRKGLIRRDDAELSRVLEAIRRESERHAATERQRQDLRCRLAADLGWQVRDVTLSKLKTVLSERHHQALADRRASLISLVGALKHEYALTALLVSDCARLNRAFLRALFGGEARSAVTYGPQGSARHQVDTMLVSMEL